MSEQKVRNTFSRIYAELERFHKVVRKDGLLEKNIMNIGGDPTYLQDMREHIDFLMNSLEDAEQGALGHIVESQSSNKNMVTEGVLDGDDEDGFMARSQLYFMARDAIQLHGIINDRDNLPNWVSSKITAASEGIDSVRRYMEYNTQVKGNEYGPQGQMDEDITRSEVEKLEDINAHSELAMRLAQEFGTEEEQELVADIYNKHMRRGHIERDEQMARDEVIRKYYNSITEEYGPEDDEFHRGLHKAFGMDGDFVPHRDRPMKGNRYELHVPVRYQKAEDAVVDVFCKKTTCNPEQIDIKYTRGQRSVKIDGQTPHPNVLSSLNSTLDRLDTGAIKGMYDESIEEDYEIENIQEVADTYAFAKAADELRKYAEKIGQDHIDFTDFNEIADTLDDLSKANIIQQSEILGDLNARLRDMDTSPREYIYSLMQAHGLMENNSAPQTAAHRRAQLPKKVKLKGFGPDAAKGNMSNPSARAALGKPLATEAESPMVRATIPNNTSDTAAKLQKLAKEKGVEYARQGRTVTLTGPRMNVKQIFFKMAYAPGNHPEMELVTETKNYEYKNGKVHISRENFRKIHKDYKNNEAGKERMVVLDPKTQATVSAPVVFTEGVDFEGSADIADPRKIAQAMMKAAKARAKKKAGK